MAVVAGFGGNITLPAATTGPNGNVEQWSCTLNIDQIPLPAAFGASYEGCALGQGRITGSARGKLDDTSHPFTTVATNAAWSGALQGNLVLTLDASHSITINNAIFNRVVVERPHNGNATWSADFRNGTSEPTITAY